MSFSEIPSDFPAISKAVSNLLTETIGPPPDMRSLGQRTLEVFQQNTASRNNIRKRDWRHVPYALWLQNSTGLANDSDAVERYLTQELPQALVDTRRPLKWGRPLIFIYIEKYKPDDALFKRISQHTKVFFDSPRIDNASSVVGLVRSLNLFDVFDGPKNTAASIAASNKTLDEWVHGHELWPSFGASPFAEAAFNEILQSREELLRSNDFINLILEWCESEKNTLRYPASRIKLAEALLHPWRNSQPNDAIKSRLMTFLLKYYGDPRIGKNFWHGVSSEAMRVLIGWINGRTLEVFFKILQETADSIWQHRQKFWTAYFKNDHIDEAWVVLGPDAALVLKRLDDTRQLKFAKLLGTESSQSVLLLRVGQILFCEWSHNGKLRAQRIDSRTAPAIYKNDYEADELRFESLDFNNGQTQDPGLIHFSSVTGGWQDRARIFIQKQTGIRLMLTDVTR